jgi:ABC-type lipoprotein export system ATPase subunit
MGARAKSLLDRVGLGPRASHLPSELSGGEQQRAAIAEVLVGGANIVVADEPTAELDSASARQVMDTVSALAAAGVTFVVATHDPAVMRRAGAVIELDHGVRRNRVAGGTAPATIAERPPTGADSGTRWRAPETAVADEPDVPLVLEADYVTKSYARGDEVVHALDRVSLSLRAGELVGLVGRSGSARRPC